LRPGYAVGQPQVATRFGCKVSRPQADVFSPLQGIFLFAAAIRDDNPSRHNVGAMLSLSAMLSHKLWLLCLPRDDIISKFREIV
jgi:hypothetical protein